MNRSRLLVAIAGFLLFPLSTAHAVPPPYTWGHRFGDIKPDVGTAVAIDASGNVYVTGSFEGTADFGGGPLASAGARDFFIAKFDRLGGHLWSRRFGGVGNDVANAIAVDAAGNVAVIGDFDGKMDLGGGQLTPLGGDDVFLAKYDANGVHQWSRRFGNTGAHDHGGGVAFDAAGDVVFTGSYQVSADFGGGPLAATGTADVFVVKFDSASAHLWSRRFGGADSCAGRAIAVDATGDVFVTGSLRGSVDFGGGALTSAGGDDVFLVKFDANCFHLWSRRAGDTGDDVGRSVAVDGAGNLLVTGSFQRTADFGGGPIPSAGSDDLFLVKLDALGAHQWSRAFGDTHDDRGFSTSVDGFGNVYVTGSYQGAPDFGGGPLPAAGTNAIALAMFDAGGTHQWSLGFDGSGDDVGRSVVVDGNGYVWLTGGFEALVDFGGGFVTSAGGTDAMLIHFKSALAGVSGRDGETHAWAVPNPSSRAVILKFRPVGVAPARVAIHDVEGRLVRRLGPVAGADHVLWDGRDDRGRSVRGGVYYASLETRGARRTTRIARVE